MISLDVCIGIFILSSSLQFEPYSRFPTIEVHLSVYWKLLQMKYKFPLRGNVAVGCFYLQDYGTKISGWDYYLSEERTFRTIPFDWTNWWYLCHLGQKQGRNEFVIRLQPSEAMYMKLTVSLANSFIFPELLPLHDFVGVLMKHLIWDLVSSHLCRWSSLGWKCRLLKVN